MVVKRKSLGKGLGDLGIGALLDQVSTTAAAPAASALQQVPVRACQPSPFQPRRVMAPEALASLADSIRAQGVINPVVVRQLAAGRYEIIAGERRWRAAQLAGLEQVPVLIKAMSDAAAMAVALIENIQREDLNVIEQATSLDRLMREFKMTHEAVAQTVGRSRAAVSNLLRLLQLPKGVKTLLENGDLEMGHARALLALPVNQQEAMARELAAGGWSVRETERAVSRRLQAMAETGATQGATPDPDVARLTRALSEHFGAPVEIKMGAKGRGKLVLHYRSLEALSGLLKQCQFEEPL